MKPTCKKTSMPTLSKTSVNLITGPLGSGKTTLLKNLLKHKPKNESWTLLVNEFGAVGIDGAILSENPKINTMEIPGGCICCSAQSELKESLEQILSSQAPDRLLIEPTGLGEPDVIVDILNTLSQSKQLNLQSIFTVLDGSNVNIDELKRYTVLQNLLNMADVLVINKVDLAPSNQIEEITQHCEILYPPKKAILTTQQSRIDPAWLNHDHSLQPFLVQPKQATYKPYSPSLTQPLRHTSVNGSNALPFTPISFEMGITRKYQNQLRVHALGYLFSNQTVFDWKKLQLLFEDFSKDKSFAGIKRAKGVFRVGKPWMLFQWANHQTCRDYITYRRDSRIDLLIDEQSSFDFISFENRLKSCVQSA